MQFISKGTPLNIRKLTISVLKGKLLSVAENSGNASVEEIRDDREKITSMVHMTGFK